MLGNTIVLNLTNAERKALDNLARIQELKPEKVMIQALRLYELVALGSATVTFPASDKAVLP